jgi:glucosamine--fructose-6-phosphate aminotransferase (isomerizing)
MILDDIGLYNNFSRYFLNCTSAIYLGRGTNFTVALEGALKLKELSYIHAEAFAAGELKHGPISLLSNDIPVFFIIPYDEWFDKSFSNFQQVLARIDQIFCLTNTKGKEKIEEYLNNQLDFTSEYQAKVHFLVIPESDPIATLFLLTLSVQLLAYFVALNKGKNIDQPRHLAKSVTVE